MHEIIDWKKLPEGREKYQVYLCSREWAERKQPVLKRCNGWCEKCGLNRATQVHHLTYARKYNEQPADLEAICTGCHEFIHGHSNNDPKDFIRRSIEDCFKGHGDEIDVLCPKCHESDLGIVHWNKPEIHPAKACIRGEKLIVPFWCEYGHAWDVVFKSYPGHTIITFENIRNEDVT